MKKSIGSIIFTLIFVGMLPAWAQSPKQMANQIIGATKNGNSAVAAPVTAENYLLKQEKLAEQMGLLLRKQSGLEKKISAKVDKKYVDEKLSGLETRLAAVEGKQGEIEGNVSTLKSAQDALENKHAETRKIVDKTVKRVDGMESTLTFVGGGVLFTVVIIIIGIIIGIVLAVRELRRRNAARAAAQAAAAGGAGSPP